MGNEIRGLDLPRRESDEGGCGVIGFASSLPVAGRHLIRPLTQMHNRGNGKGGGIATTDPYLERFMDCRWGMQRIVNLYRGYAAGLRHILSTLGLRSIAELRGQTEYLRLVAEMPALSPEAVAEASALTREGQHAE